MLGGIGVQEIVIILIVGLLVFGAARLPKIARSLGLGIKEFKKTVKGLEDDDDEEKPSNVKYVPPGQNSGQQQYPQYNYVQQNPNFPQGGNTQGVQNPQGQYQPAPGQYPPGAAPGQTPSGAGSGGVPPGAGPQQAPSGTGPAATAPGTAPNQAAGGQMPNQQMPNAGPGQPDSGLESRPSSNTENTKA